ncbi:MAG: SRPBCC family protein [Pseudomonadota bacterium]
MRIPHLLAASIALALAACASPAPPSEPIAWFDPPELLEDESQYVVSHASVTVPMTPTELRAFLAGRGSLIRYMEPVGSIAPPVDEIPLEGIWPEQGARRILIQQDGHQILEHSLKNETRDFRYQAFGFTGSAARGVDHIYADWSLTPVESGTQFDWTYRVAPKNAVARIFVRRLRDNELRPFMQGAVDRMAEAAREEKGQE